MPRWLTNLTWLLVFGTTATVGGCSSRVDSETAALELQWRLFEALALKNPNYEDTLATLLRLDPAQQERHFAALAERNARDPEIAALKEAWEDGLIRRIVSEGVAMQCNPPSGFKRTVFEDTTVVRFWLRELESVIRSVRHGETSEDSVQAWLERSYHDAARELLSDFLARAYPGSDQSRLIREHITERPSAVYTLGWWMVSHIVATPGGQDSAVALLTTPQRLFDAYNASVTDPKLRVGL